MAHRIAGNLINIQYTQSDRYLNCYLFVTALDYLHLDYFLPIDKKSAKSSCLVFRTSPTNCLSLATHTLTSYAHSHTALLRACCCEMSVR